MEIMRLGCEECMYKYMGTKNMEHKKYRRKVKGLGQIFEQAGMNKKVLWKLLNEAAKEARGKICINNDFNSKEGKIYAQK